MVTKQEIASLTSAIQQLTEKITQMDSKLDSTLVKIEAVNTRVSTIEERLNQVEQHQRSHSIRIFGLKMESKESTLWSTAHCVFDALKPILQLAVDAAALPTLPSVLEVIDIAHPLPSKDTATPPIIVRLRSKLYRAMILNFKASYFKQPEAVKFSIVEDMTKANALLLKTTKEKPDVLAAWFRNGRVKYKLSSDTSKTLTAVF